MLNSALRHRITPALTQDRVPGKCWIWQGPVNKDGYGRAYIAGRDHYTHRFIYQSLVEPIADGLTIDHLCRNRACCNPRHLEPVTRGINVQRGAPATKTRCDRGHRLAGHNLIVKKSGSNGRRECRTCMYLRQRAYEQRKARPSGTTNRGGSQ